jgi:hypothetical protein
MQSGRGDPSRGEHYCHAEIASSFNGRIRNDENKAIQVTYNISPLRYDYVLKAVSIMAFGSLILWRWISDNEIWRCSGIVAGPGYRRVRSH